MEAQMRNLMMHRQAGSCVALIARSIALMMRKPRAWRQDDALARLDDRVLRDIGMNRFEVRYMSARECALSTADGGLTVEPGEDLLEATGHSDNSSADERS
jgi:uncharacterized protein YjiS (DUF1127 family)